MPTDLVTTHASPPRAAGEPEGRARLGYLIRLLTGRAVAESESERRYVRISQGTVSALAGRGVGILVNVITIPLSIGYLGAERYGVWITLSTALAWFQLADLGVVNGLTNAVSEANACKDRALAQSYVATAFWLLLAISFALAGIFGASFAFLQWADLLGATGTVARAEIPGAVALGVIAFLLSLPLSLTERVYVSNQEGALANTWGIAANVTSLLSVVAVTRTHGGLPALVLAVAGSRLVVLAASSAWLFFVHRPFLAPRPGALSRRALGRLGKDGSQLFAIQLAALLLFGTDNYIIARVIGVAAVTPYSVTWSLFSVPQMLAALTFPYLWAAYSDAVAQRDVAWVMRTFRRSLLLCVGFAVLVSVPLALFGTAIIRFWAGQAAVPPGMVLVWMAVWSVVYAFMSALSCLLNASGRFRGQTIYGLATAVLNIVLSVWWAGRFGLPGVIAATIAAFAVGAMVPATVESMLLLKSMKRAAA